MARYTTDVIGSCAFGTECSSLREPQAEFRQVGRRIFRNSNRSIRWRIFKMTYLSSLAKLGLPVRILHPDITKFFNRIVRETVELRERENIRRNDFMDLLLDLRRKRTHHGADGRPGLCILRGRIRNQFQQHELRPIRVGQKPRCAAEAAYGDKRFDRQARETNLRGHDGDALLGPDHHRYVYMVGFFHLEIASLKLSYLLEISHSRNDLTLNNVVPWTPVVWKWHDYLSTKV